MALDVEVILLQLKATADVYKTVQSTKIPDTVQEAAEQRWQLAIAAAEALEIKLLLYYDPDQMAADRQRVVPVDAVLRSLRDLEEMLVLGVTSGERKDVLSAWEGLAGLIIKTIHAFVNAIKIWWKSEDVPWAAILGPILLHVLEIAAVSKEGKRMERALSMRESHEVKSRKRALPQRAGPRYLRRKKTRT